MEKKSVSVKDGDKEIKFTGFSVDEVEKILKSAEMTEGDTGKKTGVEIKEIALEKSITDLPEATVKSLRKGLSQKGTIDRGSFVK